MSLIANCFRRAKFRKPNICFDFSSGPAWKKKLQIFKIRHVQTMSFKGPFSSFLNQGFLTYIIKILFEYELLFICMNCNWLNSNYVQKQCIWTYLTQLHGPLGTYHKLVGVQCTLYVRSGSVALKYPGSIEYRYTWTHCHFTEKKAGRLV